MTDVLRYTAFSSDPAGGNPAGVVLDAASLSDAEMRGIATEVGYSETAFLTSAPDGADGADGSYPIRYFSPEVEVAFCGHATVATAVALAERTGPGDVRFHTRSGLVPVTVASVAGALKATLTSTEPVVADVADDDVVEALAALDWAASDLDPALPPRLAYAGVWHLILAAGTRQRLAELDYDFERLLALSRRLDLTTFQLVWRESTTVFHVRDPFPVGGVVEDPATGAAAAAFGAYARELGLVGEDARFTIHQGHDMGRPGLLEVEVRAGDPRIRVTGTATRLPAG